MSRFYKAHVGGKMPGICPLAGLGAVEQRMTKRVPARGRLCGRPGRQRSRQRAVVPAERNRTNRAGDLPADGVMVQAVLGLGVLPPSFCQKLERTMQERPSRRFIKSNQRPRPVRRV